MSPAADFINQFTMAWTVLGLSMAIVSLSIPGRLRLIGSLSTAVLVATGGSALMREGPGPPSAAQTGSDQIRLVQFNLLKENASPEVAAAWIRSQRPDVVVLEEAALAGARVPALLRGDFPYETDCLGRRGRCSTVVMSRIAPIASGGLARGDPENRGALSAAWVTLGTPSGPLTVVGVHYGRPWPFGDPTMQRDALTRFLRSRPSGQTVVAGDMNMTPWTFAMARQDKAWPLHRVTRNLPSWGGQPIALPGGVTWVPPPLLPIDHVYVGQAWKAISVYRGPYLGSDHRPVVVTLKPRS